MTVRRIVRVVSWAGILIAASVVLAAQAPKPGAEQPKLMSASIVTVQPGMGPEYTAYQINEVMPALKKGGSTGR